MRGKKPKERERYVLRMGDGSLVEVTRQVYLEWYQSRRREKYQREKMQKYGVCSLDMIEEKGAIQKLCVRVENEPEETAIKNICVEKLRKGLEKLPEPDAFLIDLLFFKEVTVKDAAELCGCSRKTIQNRRKRILKELYYILKELGIQKGLF